MPKILPNSKQRSGKGVPSSSTELLFLKSPLVIVMLIVGFLFLVIFFIWENYCPNPLMPLYIWKDRTFSLVSNPLLVVMMTYPRLSS